MINRNSKKIKYALRFLEYLASPAYSRQINRSFDGLGPVRQYCIGDGDIRKALCGGAEPPAGLEAAVDPFWVGSMDNAYELEHSPFIPPYRVLELWGECVGEIVSGAVPTREAMKELALRINAEIQRNLELDPALRERYELALAKEAAK